MRPWVLDMYEGQLYSGQFTSLMAINTDGSGGTAVGTMPSNAGNALVSVDGSGQIYTAFGTSYSAPYPASIGTLNGGTYTEKTTFNGIYDGARNGADDLFLNANPGDGASIYQYDGGTGGFSEIVHIGGASSGLAFDSQGNLFCSFYDEGKVLGFTSAQVAAVQGGGAALTAADAGTEIALSNAGYLAFDSNDNLYASYLDASWETHIVELGMDGSTSLIGDGGGQLLAVGDTIYTIDTNWIDYASNVYAIAAVPEPATLATLFAGLSLLFCLRKKIKG